MEANNMKAMRDALKLFVEYSDFVCKMGMFNRDRLIAITKQACAALSAPPRNCEVGSVEEQVERFREFCDDEKGHREHCRNCRLCNAVDCELAWAQMPYNEGGEK